MGGYCESMIRDPSDYAILAVDKSFCRAIGFNLLHPVTQNMAIYKN